MFNELKYAIDTNKKRQKLLTDCVLAFGSDLPGYTYQWNCLRNEFFNYYQSDIQELFPNYWTYICPIEVNPKFKRHFKETMITLYRQNVFKEISVMDFIPRLQRFFRTGYGDNTLYTDFRRQEEY